MAAIKDCLNRKEDKERVLNIIRTATSRQENLSFAINGKWGTGKSFFVELVRKELLADCFVFKYDSWENDYYDDPLIGILDSIKEQLNGIDPVEKALNEAGKEAIKRVVKVLGLFLDNFVSSKIGVKPVEAIKSIKSFWKDCSAKAKISDDFNPYNRVKAAKQLIIASLNELSTIKPIVFFVDEIDRCFPTYTLKIIERIHHISENVNRCVTVFCVDANQLQKIIELVYNKEETATDEGEIGVVKGYLRKVIDFTFDLGPGDLNDDFYAGLDDYGKRFKDPIRGVTESEINKFVKHMFYGMEMRTILKIINTSKYTHDLVFEGQIYTKDLMCAELMFAWAAQEYGDKPLDKMAADLLRTGKDRKSFIQYLSKPHPYYGFIKHYDEKEKDIYVYNLRTLMAYFALENKGVFWPEFVGEPGMFSTIPPYEEQLLKEYLQNFSKIKC